MAIVAWPQNDLDLGAEVADVVVAVVAGDREGGLRVAEVGGDFRISSALMPVASSTTPAGLPPSGVSVNAV